METTKLLRCMHCGGDFEEINYFKDYLIYENEFMELKCKNCEAEYKVIFGVTLMVNPASKFYNQVEVNRYNEIAVQGYHKYYGLEDTHPELRAKLVKKMLKDKRIDEFLNIGPGFCFLEDEINGEIKSIALDEAINFLRIIRINHPKILCVNALAEELPFKDESIGCIVSDSAFQSVNDRNVFLDEMHRVLEIGGLLIFSIAFGWNYPRKDQDGYNLIESGGLQRLIEKLSHGFSDLELRYWKAGDNEFSTSIDSKSNYLWITARRR